MTDELKKCPICGSESELNSLICPDNGLMQWPNCSNENCCLSDKWSARSGNREEAVAAWNRRTPEPGTSVIRWTRYDGTPGTLPEEGEEVLFHSDEYGYEVVVLRKCPALIWTHFVYAREMREHFLTVNAGDLWAYLPKPPEKME